MHDKAAPVPVSYLGDITRDAHDRTMALVAGLSDDQLMGPRMPIVNPFVWEIGHVAWFHENFILRDLDGNRPMIEGGDNLFEARFLFFGEDLLYFVVTFLGPSSDRIPAFGMGGLGNQRPNRGDFFLLLGCEIEPSA